MQQDFIDLLLKDTPDANLSLPDPSLLQYYQDLKNRTYWINDEIGDNYLDLVSKIVTWNREDRVLPPGAGRKPIKIFFNSPGGSLDIEEALVSIIQLSQTPVWGFALGMVASAASLVFLSCDRRFALPNAYLIAHKGSYQSAGANYNEMIAAIDDYKQQVEKMVKFYIDHTGYTEEEVRKNIETDWYIRMPEAKERGVVTDIITDISVML